MAKMDRLALLTARAVVDLAKRQCVGNEDCNQRGVMPGRKNRPTRCYDCPLDAVDDVADALLAQEVPADG